MLARGEDEVAEDDVDGCCGVLDEDEGGGGDVEELEGGLGGCFVMFGRGRFMEKVGSGKGGWEGSGSTFDNAMRASSLSLG